MAPDVVHTATARPTTDDPRGRARPVSMAGALALANRALRQVERIDVVAFADLGDIALPPVVGGADDQDLLRFVAPLYLASELEAAGLLDALDTMARLFASGGVQRDLGGAVEPLTDVWRTRHRRFNGDERRAIHGRLFGGDPTATLGGAVANSSFEPTFIGLVERLARAAGGPLQRTVVTGIAEQARQVAYNLSGAAAGVPSLAARELLGAVETALRVFGIAEVQRWLNARSVWSALDSANRRFGRSGVRTPDVISHVRRGRSGVVVFAWLADALPALRSSTAVPRPVVDAAIEWADATIALWGIDEPRAGS